MRSTTEAKPKETEKPRSHEAKEFTIGDAVWSRIGSNWEPFHWVTGVLVENPFPHNPDGVWIVDEGGCKNRRFASRLRPRDPSLNGADRPALRKPEAGEEK